MQEGKSRSTSNLRQFSFGANWQTYLEELSESRIQMARKDIEDWIGVDGVRGKRVMDMGSGSGIHSLVFFQMGASEVVSIDVDEKSVAATTSLWKACGEPGNWRVEHGSILDDELVRRFEQPGFDIVYSWGVLHHTGAMWKAIENAMAMITPGGLFMVALYVKGPHYRRDLELKRKFNRVSAFGKKLIYARYVVRRVLKLLFLRNFRGIKTLLFPKYFERRRGMNMYVDIIDWLGGLPYEVASAAEVVAFTRKHYLVLERIETAFEGGNNIFLFSRPDPGMTPSPK